MRKARFLFLFCWVFLLGCDFVHNVDWEKVAEIFLIGTPEKIDGREVVALIWSKSESPTLFQISNSFSIGCGDQNVSGIWYCYPVNNVPLFLRGKVLSKKIRIKYRIIRSEGVPLIEIKEISVEKDKKI